MRLRLFSEHITPLLEAQELPVQEETPTLNLDLPTQLSNLSIIKSQRIWRFALIHML